MIPTVHFSFAPQWLWTIMISSRTPLVLHIGRSTILAIMQGCHVPRGFQLQEWNHESKTETLLIMVQTDPTLKSTLDLNDPKLDEVGTTPLRNRPAMTKKMGRFLILLGLWSCVATMVQFEDTKRVFDISRGLFSRWLIENHPTTTNFPPKQLLIGPLPFKLSAVDHLWIWVKWVGPSYCWSDSHSCLRAKLGMPSDISLSWQPLWYSCSWIGQSCKQHCVPVETQKVAGFTIYACGFSRRCLVSWGFAEAFYSPCHRHPDVLGQVMFFNLPLLLSAWVF